MTARDRDRRGGRVEWHLNPTAASLPARAREHRSRNLLNFNIVPSDRFLHISPANSHIGVRKIFFNQRRRIGASIARMKYKRLKSNCHHRAV